MADQEQHRAQKRKRGSNSVDKLLKELQECRKARAKQYERKMGLHKRLVNAVEAKGTSKE